MMVISDAAFTKITSTAVFTALLSTTLFQPASAQAEVLSCRDTVELIEKGGQYDPFSTTSKGWLAKIVSTAVIDPDGKAQTSIRDDEAYGKVAIGSAIRAELGIHEQRPDGRSILKPGSIKFYSRWVAPRDVSIDGQITRCSSEKTNNPKPQTALEFTLRFADQKDLDAGGGVWHYVAYDEKRIMLALFKFNIEKEPTPREKADEWLAGAYERYLILDKCVDLYAASLSKREYRAAMSAIEAEAKKRSIDTDAVWKRVNEGGKEVLQMWSGFVASRASMTYEQRSNVRDLCSSASRALISQAQELQPASSTPKKDF